jgi:predicted RecB family nuclease
MLITDDIFQAFLQCETKSHLKLSGTAGDQRAFPYWERNLVEDYKRQCYSQLRAAFREVECLVGGAFPQDLENSGCRLVMACTVRAQEMQSHLHAVERVVSPGTTNQSPYIPIRCVPREKITTQDKLLLAFDALVLWTVSGEAPRFGKIIHGGKQATTKVDVAGWMNIAKTVVSKIAAQQANPTPPPLILNQHCAACEFKARCRQIAIEKDELSLLARMTAKERKQQHAKGIFSVTQLSYTFRARRKPRRFVSKPDKYSHALRALALREGKIHIAGRPELNIHGNPVYLDVEGIPDCDFYYLIGLRIKSGDTYVHYAFWANALSEEQEIWAAFLQTLAQIDHPQLIHYGSYETTFLKRMQARYRAAVEHPAFLDQLIAESVNVLSVIYAQIYFPTYSNGLKEIAQYLGFQWSESDASGLHTLMWRSQWECSKDAGLKQKLVTYNAEDCEALERVASTVAQLCQRQTEVAKSKDGNIVHTDSLKRESLYRFGKNTFSMPELEDINQAAYWDYQRDKIYIRSSPRLKHISQKIARGRAKALPVNKIVECPAPNCCPKCKTKKILKLEKTSKIVHDLKFGRTGIKRWIVKYSFDRYLCRKCGISFYFQQIPRTRSPFGSELINYVIYQIIELRLPQETIAQSLNQLFDFHLGHSAVNRQKERAAQFYKGTYEGILNKIVTGKLIHADETKISIEGKDAFVWVFTNLEEVAYYYTKTREGDFLQELLREFRGVLVSDFYTAYDSINCPQQKCLIHFLRDLNDDLLKQPFNEELKELVRDFARLLKPMIATIDRFGLKAHFLRKHKVFVEHFYKELSKRDYQSEIAIYYKKRFEKNRDKLFTCLDYDNVPWNNNNAEHAIKAFAALRKGIGGTSTEKGIREYLTLLSICETCKYKGVNFLEFLRSGEKDIDAFIKQGARVSKQSGFLSRLRE